MCGAAFSAFEGSLSSLLVLGLSLSRAFVSPSSVVEASSVQSKHADALIPKLPTSYFGRERYAAEWQGMGWGS